MFISNMNMCVYNTILSSTFIDKTICVREGVLILFVFTKFTTTNNNIYIDIIFKRFVIFFILPHFLHRHFILVFSKIIIQAIHFFFIRVCCTKWQSYSALCEWCQLHLPLHTSHIICCNFQRCWFYRYRCFILVYSQLTYIFIVRCSDRNVFTFSLLLQLLQLLLLHFLQSGSLYLLSGRL